MPITIAARPQPYAFEPSATAMVAVDLQNDFGAKGGYVDSFGVPIEGTRATIGPIARVLGYSVLGVQFGTGMYRVPIGAGITSAVVMYILSLAGVYVLALIIDGLAPTFGGTKNQIQALKVAAYSSTASWVAGVFSILPGLRALTLLGFYSIYVLYLGLPVLMKAPAEKAGAYTAIVIVAAIVLFALVTMLAGTFAATAMG